MLIRALWIVILSAGLAACGGDDGGSDSTESPAPVPEAATPQPASNETAAPDIGNIQGPAFQDVLDMPADLVTANPDRNATRNVYFGDLHVHTTYSFDAFAFGTLATPRDAYRFAKGESIKHPAGFDMQLDEPLDFYAVTDHAMFLGVSRVVADPSTDFAKVANLEYMRNLNAPENMRPGGTTNRGMAFSSFLGDLLTGIVGGKFEQEDTYEITNSAWVDTIEAAEAFYEPGKFTTFVAYEYTTSSEDRGNLHRNVFFKDADRLPLIPLSRFHSRNPEGLWDWMDDLREQGVESLAIPHNSNGSNGQMFKLVDWAGNPLDDAYAEQRVRNEPLVEITQIKGDSETHPMLSDTDEWADFEIMPYRIATRLYSEPSGSYVREALLNGLAFEDKGIENPFKLGFVGATDAHIAATPVDESDFYGKIGLLDATPSLTGAIPMSEQAAKVALENNPDAVKEFDGKYYRTAAPITWGSSGLAAVWAEENTRESIYNAFRRKETFATTGPRIKLRFFGGYDFDADLLDRSDWVASAYRDGVAMGSDLLPKEGKTPTLVAWATRDLNSAPLQRLQVIKGWTVDGEHHEMVYDVACSDGLSVDPRTHRCPDNGAQVDLTDCSISTDVGAAELKAVWRDPDFNPAHRAFYYIRVLENPTCRWSTWDAIKAGHEPRPDFPATIQERAYTSPIWYQPPGQPGSQT